MSAKVCIHDGECSDALVLEDAQYVRRVWCKNCDNLLFVVKSNTSDFGSTVTVYDGIYELLHTKKGRRKLLEEALSARGLPIPKTWKDLIDD